MQRRPPQERGKRLNINDIVVFGVGAVAGYYLVCFVMQTRQVA